MTDYSLLDAEIGKYIQGDTTAICTMLLPLKGNNRATINDEAQRIINNLTTTNLIFELRLTFLQRINLIFADTQINRPQSY